MFRQRAYNIALLVSILIHLLLLLLYKPLTGLTDILPLTTLDEMQPPEDIPPLEFELVETPDDAATQEPPEDAQALSDKNARVQDMYQQDDLETGTPYSEGQTDYKIFAGAGGQMMPPPMPAQPSEPEQEAAEADRPSQEESQEASEGEAAVYERKQSFMQKPQRFNRNMLLGAGEGRSAGNRSFSDDLNWDNEKFTAEALGGVSLNTYAWDFAPYIFYMKKRLRNHIYPPPAYYQMGAISGEVVLRFKVYPDGNIGDLEMLSYKGHKAFVGTSLNAVKASSPFKPLPENFPEKYLELTWTFIYSVF